MEEEDRRTCCVVLNFYLTSQKMMDSANNGVSQLCVCERKCVCVLESFCV